MEKPPENYILLQIDIPGPGPASGDGFDWVKVEVIEDKSQPGADEENYGMRVRSCTNPNTPESDTSHFLPVRPLQVL